MNNIVLCGQKFVCDSLKGANKNSLEQLENNQYKATNSGILVEKQDYVKFVPTTMNYFPNTGDRVIGYVEKRHGDFYQLEIKAHRKAVLGYLDFEGATKKNKPDLKTGTIVYTRILECSKYTELILTCISKTVKKDWNSGEAFYGELKNGYDIEIPCFFAYYLLNDESFFEILKRKISLEVCIGINGVLWIKTQQPINYLILENFFQKAPYYSKQKAAELLLGMMNSLTVQLFVLENYFSDSQLVSNESSFFSCSFLFYSLLFPVDCLPLSISLFLCSIFIISISYSSSV